ncbi:TniQ family protein [Polynucleobacter asymbioticus]|jgi:hypothetical protein|uniref:TniQ domain-containing protein n=1 Tax=Polynucleobacter asymbioticus TaxID=576611 RepID=A0AAC9IY84_9BURK|nr:TniQ family protein [Polynucleobacter asymbioticus]APB99652.1 hypothetical protein A4F89_10055 [Polynucleobacter asymbioticus]APC01958.1 hypothetical protein AOC25_10190 [Polynucleobacter asymbioticus]
MVKPLPPIGELESKAIRELEKLGGNWLPQYERIYGMPSIEKCESFSSWVARASLATEIPLNELMGAMRIAQPPHSVDLGVIHLDLERISGITGANIDSLLHLNFPEGSILSESKFSFLSTHQLTEKPLYQFCPYCLQADATPYLRSSWRLSITRICPMHKVELRDCCHQCKKKVNLSHLRKMRDFRGFFRIPSLLFCNFCMTNLASAPTQALRDNILTKALDHQAVIDELIKKTFNHEIPIEISSYSNKTFEERQEVLISNRVLRNRIKKLSNVYLELEFDERMAKLGSTDIVTFWDNFLDREKSR